jgi:hypothetical protein
MSGSHLATRAMPPAAQITSPSSGATYTRGQLVVASFGCLEGADRPGLASCTGTVPNDMPIDTATLGPHTFTVTVISSDGQRATRTVTYTVIEPSEHITVSHVKAHADGTISFQAGVRSPGKLDVLETAWYDTRTHGASGRQSAWHRVASGRAHAVPARAGVLSLRVSFTAEGKRLVRHRRHAVLLRLWVTYTPNGGTPRSVSFYGLHLGRGCPDAASSGKRTNTNCAP